VKSVFAEYCCLRRKLSCHKINFQYAGTEKCVALSKACAVSLHYDEKSQAGLILFYS
jgi:hypothetical protein